MELAAVGRRRRKWVAETTPLVPQFYLRRFTDKSELLLVVGSSQRPSFRRKPPRRSGGKASLFTELAELGHDPLTMEKQFSDLEGEVARITAQWLDWIKEIEPGEKIDIPHINREIMSLYIVLQFLRTADTRQTLAIYWSENIEPISEVSKRHLHTSILGTMTLSPNSRKESRIQHGYSAVTQPLRLSSVQTIRSPSEQATTLCG